MTDAFTARVIETLKSAKIEVERHGYQGLEGATVTLAHLRGEASWNHADETVEWSTIAGKHGSIKIAAHPGNVYSSEHVTRELRRWMPYAIKCVENSLKQTAAQVIQSA